ncbi:ABC transporter ATP-binding protein [Candidatus Galacturonibacter soehngenii]|uniref:ATP-binding cassette domain-containing protein n=1 Tax=Candidatus Galacturonatibacter soehngenii TaxID=2307010 RepID=A0A7V7UGC6_9FIRM|nr:ATP-binding cassette domain-containing protein [Candidatus Galacturonibacter soehngenii]KAB1438356.1 ATP-binding cassette domain-containing protein [Candidatus Galacturonibacter soehngenii]
MKNSDYIIETQHLTKAFNKNIVVNDVSINVKRGQIYGLLGRNGAGKTTIMRMLLNLALPTKGQIKLFGEEISKNQQNIYHRIGSLIESPGFYNNLTGRQNLQILSKLRGNHKESSVDDALEIVGLKEEHTKIFSNYSLGMKQRLGIAAAIMHEPELLILDEPTNGLDPVGIALVREYLEQLCKETGTTILISSHILSEIEQIADVIGILHEGQMVEEVSMDLLHEKNREYIEFVVSDAKKASFLLEEEFHMTDYRIVGNHSIQLFQNFEARARINHLFVQNDIEVSTIQLSEKKLEDYFKELIGGDVIG